MVNKRNIDATESDEGGCRILDEDDTLYGASSYTESCCLGSELSYYPESDYPMLEQRLQMRQYI